jgi:glutamine phosphoribosylpyrophosphate amidotransferase
MNFPDPKELIANQLVSVEGIRNFLGIHSLAHLSVEGLMKAVKAGSNYCNACFTAEYPVPYDAHFEKSPWKPRGRWKPPKGYGPSVASSLRRR